MGANREGGLKVKEILLSRNPNHYSEIGTLGGNAPKTRPAGFASMTPEQRRKAGAKGGRTSRRNKERYAA